MNEFLLNLAHLTSVIGTIFMVSVLLIAFANILYPKLRAEYYIIKLAQGLTYAFVVTVAAMFIDYLIR